MKYTALTAIAAITFATSGAFAQTTSPANPSPAGGVKLSQSECTNVWQRANPSGAASLTQAQAAPYVSDFKAANPDGDNTIDQNEWMAACNKGLVRSSSGSGSSTGSSGSN
ncbi:MAG: hypothetical protein B7Y80_19460 [Hyphomicrobium sp. 32-62-53]|nr:MAG: hypothetical protein B7Z29_16860 [Hyphomicrobium sp. 12-62-95]OYX97507.1 MAG: hypothetical protein B7Y80_19460 [Hyphomicrobium sp. 32-62-53]